MSTKTNKLKTKDLIVAEMCIRDRYRLNTKNE